MTLLTIIALFASVLLTAIASIRAAQRRNRTAKLDNAIFRRNDE